jgi:hypothetical protein
MSSAMYTEYYAQLVNARTGMPINDDTGKFIVMTAGSPVLATIYSDANGTVPSFVATNVASTMTDGIIQFWTGVSVTSVDVTIRMANGESIFIMGLTPSQHRIEVDVDKPSHMLVLPYYNYIPTPYVSASITATGSKWHQGITLPAKTLVKDCWCKVVTTGTAAIRSFGVSASASGFLGVVTGDITGYKIPKEPYVLSATATFCKGMLLLAADTTCLIRTNYLVSALTAPVFFNGTETTLAADCGYVYITYDKLYV